MKKISVFSCKNIFMPALNLDIIYQKQSLFLFIHVHIERMIEKSTHKVFYFILNFFSCVQTIKYAIHNWECKCETKLSKFSRQAILILYPPPFPTYRVGYF